ncbi:MAG: hypothetical protein V2I39_11620 [Erythrobacter sp.]|jgi:hypothetical protein|nr:hypothetical protein [Erythrobacter sp.]
MSGGALAVWAIGLAVAFAVGWARGRAGTPQEAPQAQSGEWRAGYVAGFDDAREEALRVARAHDFNTIERQVSRMRPKP